MVDGFRSDGRGCRPPAPWGSLRRTGGGLGAALAGCLLLALVVTTLPGRLPAQSPTENDPQALEEKRRQIERLDAEQSQIRTQLRDFDASEQEIQAEVEKLAEVIRRSRARKREIEEQLKEVLKTRERLEGELGGISGRISHGEQRIRLRLRRLYRLTKAQDSAAIYQLGDDRDYAKNSHYMAILQRNDREALESYRELFSQRREKRLELERSQAHLEELQRDLERETEQLALREAFLKESMTDIGKNRRLYQSYLEDLGRTVEGMRSAIVRLERQATVQKNQPDRESLKNLRGRMPPPVQGDVIAAFGQLDPRYDLKKFQRGIVIRVGENTEVRAVGPGTTVHAGPFRGYQSLVVIDHGEGLFTVYGHLEGLRVQRGDRIDAGTTVGIATYQPLYEAYDVYFELRNNGKPEDPLLWMPTGALPVPSKEPAAP